MTPEEAYEEALRRILKAEQHRAVKLDLSRLTLNRFPREVARVTSLQALDIFRCEQLSSDLSPLADLTSLQSLNLSGCEPSDDLTSLQSLSRLSGDLSPLADLTSFQSLDLSWWGPLSGDLSPLANLTSLQSLNLPQCKQLSGDLSPLAGLTSLQWSTSSGANSSAATCPRWLRSPRSDRSSSTGVPTLENFLLWSRFCHNCKDFL
jgi:hypothetical protein